MAQRKVHGGVIDESLSALNAHLDGMNVWDIAKKEPSTEGYRSGVLQILQTVDSPGSLLVCLGAVRVLRSMASSVFFDSIQPGAPHRLVSISRGHVEKLREDVHTRLAMEGEAADSVTEKIRGELVDFFTENVPKTRYNLAHCLLGVSEQFFEDHGNVIEAERCFSSIQEKDNILWTLLDVSLYGIGDGEMPVLASRNPALAGKIYDFFGVCLHTAVTRGFILAYLKRADFSRVFIENMALCDGASDTLRSQLVQRGRVFEIVAEEIFENSEAREFIFGKVSGFSFLLAQFVQTDKIFVQSSCDLSVLDGFHQFFWGWSKLVETLCSVQDSRQEYESIFCLLVSSTSRNDYPAETTELLLRALFHIGTQAGIPRHVSAGCFLHCLERPESTPSYRAAVYSVLLLFPEEKEVDTGKREFLFSSTLQDMASSPCGPIAAAVFLLHCSSVSLKTASPYMQSVLCRMSFLEKAGEVGNALLYLGAVRKLAQRAEFHETFLLAGIEEKIEGLVSWNRLSDAVSLEIVSEAISVLELFCNMRTKTHSLLASAAATQAIDHVMQKRELRFLPEYQIRRKAVSSSLLPSFSPERRERIRRLFWLNVQKEGAEVLFSDVLPAYEDSLAARCLVRACKTTDRDTAEKMASFARRMSCVRRSIQQGFPSEKNTGKDWLKTVGREIEETLRIIDSGV
ncbi:MAG: uncharacterized protein A8A55_0856 [Amphiamblys sp. WSBS2006]|nr:MAG: uncharacterized protein A8A55_0856 [Amphiamblys sp. WSBS2006]